MLPTGVTITETVTGRSLGAHPLERLERNRPAHGTVGLHLPALGGASGAIAAEPVVREVHARLANRSWEVMSEGGTITKDAEEKLPYSF